MEKVENIWSRISIIILGEKFINFHHICRWNTLAMWISYGKSRLMSPWDIICSFLLGPFLIVWKEKRVMIAAFQGQYFISTIFEHLICWCILMLKLGLMSEEMRCFKITWKRKLYSFENLISQNKSYF